MLLEDVRDFRTSLADRGGVQCVALDGSAIVGWCDIRRCPNEGSRHVAVVGIGILSGHRGFGLGPALPDRAVEAAADLGVSRVELEVFASNTHALHVYMEGGVREEGIKRRARILDGQTDDLVCMARFL
ncbi:MAG: GNAT family N-acetyltransferase [Gammaproteobacteria bacterium]|nr:GNAT family N-acetyltransferase [Gammaproteobacteria bacterium]